MSERLREVEVEPLLYWSAADDATAEADLRAWPAEVRRNGVEWAVRRCHRQMLVRQARFEGAVTLTVIVDTGGLMRVTEANGPATLAPLRDSAG